jgi:hypothetical protein
MAESFYEKTGTLLSPGDFLAPLPYTRVPKPLRVARKIARTLPRQFNIQGELREILELGKHNPEPAFDFGVPGEEILSRAQMARAVFLTWGSEVEGDQRGGDLHKKIWLIAPVFSLESLHGQIQRPGTERTTQLADVVRAGQSPRFFPIPAFPEEESSGFYVDFRRICPLAATYFGDISREWRLAPTSLNDFYHHLIWFFTRRKIFFGPIACPQCRSPVDLDIVFEGQPINEEPHDLG